jgi:hypothetical protein
MFGGDTDYRTRHALAQVFGYNHKHWWFSGRMLACHAGGPGSIPGQCIYFYLISSFLLPYLIKNDDSI